MNKMQRGAIFTLLTVPFVIIWIFFKSVFWVEVTVAISLIYFAVWFIRIRKVDKDKVPIDERDKTIKLNAAYTAVIILFVLSYLAIAITMAYLGLDAVITLDLLSNLLLCGLYIFFVIRAAVILVQYRFGGKDA